MTEIQFEEPPAPRLGRPGRVHDEAAEMLKGRPKEWARVAECVSANSSSSMAFSIRSGRTQAYRPVGAFEAVARKVGGQYFVYARFIGGDAA